ncbi:MAG: peptidase, partial [Acidobacteria bacterium]|nr:peptidase [Acidobacteriota bacterium]
MPRHHRSFLTLLLMGLLLVPSALEAAKPPAENPLLSPEDAPAPSFRRGNARISAETGAPVALYRLHYPVAAGTPEAMARQYLAENFSSLRLSSPLLADLAHFATREMPAGTTVRYRQTFEGIPVYGADLAVTISPAHEVSFVMNSYKPGVHVDSIVPAVSAASARARVIEHLGLNEPFAFDQTTLAIFHHDGVSRLAQQVRIAPRVAPFGDFLGLVDAQTGELLRVWDKAAYAPVDGSGLTFDPDPLSSAGATYNDPGYTDGGDADTAELNAERVAVTLRDIDLTGGTYTLRGPWADIRDSESPFEGLYQQMSDTFNFTRTQNEFEAVLTYWHIDNIMRYLNLDLGIPITPIQYSGGARFDPNGLGGADNSHYIGSTGEVAFGHGGVDDSEDADVVIHELGHALHDWVTNGNLSQVNG